MSAPVAVVAAPALPDPAAAADEATSPAVDLPPPPPDPAT
jgi:hypothetical protein